MKKKRWLCVALVTLLLVSGCEQPTVTKPAPQPTGIIDLHMADEKVGWALSPSHLYRTEDGGEHWNAVLTFNSSDVVENGVPKPLDPQKLHVAYNGAREVWISEATEAGASPFTVQHSGDGGESWETYAAPTVGEMQFIDGNHGWMFENLGIATGGEVVALHRTETGVRSWNEPNSFPMEGYKTGVSFTDREHGFATGYVRDVEELFFYKTGDGGRTWEKQPLQVPALAAHETYWTDPPQFFGTDGVMAVRGAREPVMTFLTTHDSGASWLESLALPYVKRPLRDSQLVWNGRAVDVVYDFLDAQHGWVADQTQLYVTEDGGLHWKTLPADRKLSGALEQFRFKQLQFVNENFGWALLLTAGGKNSEILKTTDGGKTWK